jgi:hypothetical protein
MKAGDTIFDGQRRVNLRSKREFTVRATGQPQYWRCVRGSRSGIEHIEYLLANTRPVEPTPLGRVAELEAEVARWKEAFEEAVAACRETAIFAFGIDQSEGEWFWDASEFKQRLDAIRAKSEGKT